MALGNDDESYLVVDPANFLFGYANSFKDLLIPV
jgi:hypothetical protein